MITKGKTVSRFTLDALNPFFFLRCWGVDQDSTCHLERTAGKSTSANDQVKYKPFEIICYIAYLKLSLQCSPNVSGCLMVLGGWYPHGERPVTDRIGRESG